MAWNHSLVNFVTFKKNEDFLVRLSFHFAATLFLFSVDGLKVKAAAYCILYGAVIEH